MNKVIEKKKEILEIIGILENKKLEPEEVNNYLENKSSALAQQKVKAAQVLLRPEVTLKSMTNAISAIQDQLNVFSDEALEQAEIQIKYQVYLDKEEEMVKKMRLLEEQIIPESFNYENVSSLSNEARQKFKKIKPQTLGQASRISGVNPSDVQILMVYMGR